jgi:hypothetical protein
MKLLLIGVGFIFLFLVGCSENTSVDVGKVIVIKKESENKIEKLVYKKVLRTVLEQHKIDFIKENCKSIYFENWSEYLRFPFNYNLDIESEFNKNIIETNFIEKNKNTNISIPEVFVLISEMFNDREKTHNIISEHCGWLSFKSTDFVVENTIRVIGDHFYFYNKEEFDMATHISNYERITNLSKRSFKFGNMIDINGYSLWIKFKNNENFRQLDYKTKEEAEKFISTITKMYDVYMKNKIYIEDK